MTSPHFGWIIQLQRKWIHHKSKNVWWLSWRTNQSRAWTEIWPCFWLSWSSCHEGCLGGCRCHSSFFYWGSSRIRTSICFCKNIWKPFANVGFTGAFGSSLICTFSSIVCFVLQVTKCSWILGKIIKGSTGLIQNTLLSSLHLFLFISVRMKTEFSLPAACFRHHNPR